MIICQSVLLISAPFCIYRTLQFLKCSLKIKTRIELYVRPPVACRGRSGLMNSALPAPHLVCNLAGQVLKLQGCLKSSRCSELRVGIPRGTRAKPSHTHLPQVSAQHHNRPEILFSKVLSIPKQFYLKETQDSNAGFLKPLSLSPCTQRVRVI